MTLLRVVPPDFDAKAVLSIDSMLGEIRQEHGIMIPLAVESGSRAWGFPSPDSDFDCRFIYVRQKQDYASLFSHRDVIEVAPDKLLDVNGWDIAKALKLLLNGNAVVVEWLTSPIIYRADSDFRDAFLALADVIGDRLLFAKHYFHLAQAQLKLLDIKGDATPLKKIFYILRPLAALEWLRVHKDKSVAPMNFLTLCSEIELQSDVRNAISDLICQKSVTRELGYGSVPEPIRRFIHAQMAKEFSMHRNTISPSVAENKILADTFFRRVIGLE